MEAKALATEITELVQKLTLEPVSIPTSEYTQEPTLDPSLPFSFINLKRTFRAKLQIVHKELIDSVAMFGGLIPTDDSDAYDKLRAALRYVDDYLLLHKFSPDEARPFWMIMLHIFLSKHNSYGGTCLELVEEILGVMGKYEGDFDHIRTGFKLQLTQEI